MDGRRSWIALLIATLLPLSAATACTSRPPPAPAAPFVPAPPGTAQFPAQAIDLANWYLTLPTGKQDQPDEVHQPQLNTFTDPWFHLDDTRTGVVFTANAGGVTTKNSTYPRSELREMTGAQKASWSNTTGNHVLRLRQAVTRLPTVKPQVVTAQIHDAEDDVIEVRLEDRRLLVAYDNGSDKIILDPAYVLDTPYDLEIDAAGGHVRMSYNATQKADITTSGSGWYFKTGSYVQSNPYRGDTPDVVGQVVLYSLTVQHTP